MKSPRLPAAALWLSTGLLLALLYLLPHSASLFARLFPEVERPLYTQDSFASLVLAHLLLVLASSLIAVLGGGRPACWSADRPGASSVPCWTVCWPSARRCRLWRYWPLPRR